MQSESVWCECVCIWTKLESGYEHSSPLTRIQQSRVETELMVKPIFGSQRFYQNKGASPIITTQIARVIQNATDLKKFNQIAADINQPTSWVDQFNKIANP